MATDDRRHLFFRSPTTRTSSTLIRLLCLLITVTAVEPTSSSFGLSIVTAGPDRRTELEGNSVRFECTVTGRDFDYFYNQIIWYKVVTDANTGSETEVQINTGAIVNELFYSTQRYSVEPVVTSSAISLFLIITDLLHEDNGTYRCALFHKQQRLSAVSHTLFVPGLIDRLSLIIKEEDATGSDDKNHTAVVANGTSAVEHFKAIDGQRVRVTCIASGRGIVPDIRVSFGQHTDVTSTFSRIQSQQRIGRLGLDTVLYNVQLVRQNVKLTSDDDGKHLKCAGNIHGFQQLSRRVATTVDVRYVPKFLCMKHRHAVPGERHYQLDCIIRANPPVNSSDVSWLLSDANNSSVQWPLDDLENVYSITAQRDAGHPNQLKVVLTIKHVTQSTYGVYHLSAFNAVGSNASQIALHPAPIKPTRPQSVSSLANTNHANVVYYTRNAGVSLRAVTSLVLLGAVACWQAMTQLLLKIVAQS